MPISDVDADARVPKRISAGGSMRTLYLTAALICSASMPVLADEAGVSFWLPGTMGSMAAVPVAPGLSAAAVYYHTSVSAGTDVAASREVQIGRFTPNAGLALSANLRANGDLLFLAPNYTFATPVMGGQAAIGVTAIAGRARADLAGTVAAVLPPFAVVRTDSISDQVNGFGDLYPRATLRWNEGVHNWMTYVTGGIPVGAYDPARIINLGIGHGAVDAGGGYTYFNPQRGFELSAVAGITYNFRNEATDYRNGSSIHVDVAASQFLSKQFFVGAVGYTYNQITADSGSGARLGAFKSRVAAIGPQAGMLFPLGDMQGVLNLKGYWEFDAQNRAKGWNGWLTFAISPPAPPPPIARTLK